MGKIIDLQGKTFGALTVVKRVENKIQRNGSEIPMWECKCKCGNTKIVSGSNLRTSHTQSCGCWKVIKTSIKNTKHGLHNHPAYKLWKNIKGRCLCGKGATYETYGGRGITICDEWINNPVKFIDWCENNGYEKGLQIDRIDNDGNYTPANCRFVTRKKNMLNQRLIKKSNTSGYRGICWDNKNKSWRVRISTNKKRVNIGYYNEIKDAIKARNKYIIDNNLQDEHELQ